MLLDQLGPPGFRFNDFEAPRYPFITLYARTDGQAVVCPLLRGSSPTRGVAPKQHRGLGRAFTPAFRAGSLSLRICRGEIWFRPARCCSTSSGRPDLDLMISRPRVTLSSPSTRALMARQWSARCYGVARPREGSRQNSIGVAALTLAVSLTPARGAPPRVEPPVSYGVSARGRPRSGLAGELDLLLLAGLAPAGMAASFAARSKCEILTPSKCLPLRLRTPLLLDEVGTSHLCYSTKSLRSSPLRGGQEP